MEEINSMEVANNKVVDKLFEQYEEAFSDLATRIILRDYGVAQNQLALMNKIEKVAREILGQQEQVFTIKAVRIDHEQA